MDAGIVLVIMGLTVVFLLTLIKVIELIKDKSIRKTMKKKHKEDSFIEFL